MRALFCLVLVLLSPLSNASVNMDVFEQYQQLSRWLEHEELDVTPFKRFYENTMGTGAGNEALAISLYLQACLKLQQHDCALKRVNELLTLSQTNAQKKQLIRLSAQLNYQLKQYHKTLEQVPIWFSIEVNDVKSKKNQYKEARVTIDAELNSLGAYSAYYLHQWTLAERYIKAVIESKPSIKNYQFLLAIYQKAQALHSENGLLKETTELFPEEKSFWLRLAQNSLILKRQTDAIAALSVIDTQKKLTEKQRILLAQLQLLENTPIAALTTLESIHFSSTNLQEANGLKLDALLLSRQRERALAFIEANPKITTPKSEAQLAYLEGEWKKATKLLNRLISAEPNASKWKLMKAMAHFELLEYQQAKDELELLLGSKFDTTAKQWLAQVDYLSPQK